MKKLLSTFCLIILIVPFALAQEAPKLDLALATETDILLLKEYDAEIFGNDVEVELEGQSYLLGCELALGRSLKVTPKIGVWNSSMELAEWLELDNELGLTAGVDVEYDLLELYGTLLSLTGSYRYADTEIDEIKIISTGYTFSNPIRNDLNIHSYEAGLNLAYQALPLGVVPYVGLVYSDSQIDFETEPTFVSVDFDGEADDNLGLRFGISANPIQALNISIAGKLLDEKAIMIKGVYNF